MQLTRDEVYEILTDMQRALDVMRAAGLNEGKAYIMLWRRMHHRLEETLNRHPY